MPQLRGAEPRNYRSFPRKRESRLLLVPAFAGTSGTILLGTLAYRQAPCERAVLSAAFAVSQSGRPIAILLQPTPQGVPALSHQIRHQPSSKRTSAKSARAGVTSSPIARRATAKAKRCIAGLLLRWSAFTLTSPWKGGCKPPGGVMRRRR